MTDINQENGENLEVSPTDQQPAADQVNVSDDQQTASSPSDDTKTAEENAWEQLKGTTQDRIKQLIHERDEYKEKATQQVQQDNQWAQKQYPTQSQPQQTQEDVQQAIRTLKENGVATKDDLYALLGQIKTDRDHERLSDKYDGGNGLPKYEKSEVEDYMRRKQMYGNPEAAFRDMYFDEFVDSGKKTVRRGSSYTSEKPTAASTTARNEPLTLESFREKLDPSNPKSREYYAKLMKNPALFDSIVAQLQK